MSIYKELLAEQAELIMPGTAMEKVSLLTSILNDQVAKYHTLNMLAQFALRATYGNVSDEEMAVVLAVSEKVVAEARAKVAAKQDAFNKEYPEAAAPYSYQDVLGQIYDPSNEGEVK